MIITRYQINPSSVTPPPPLPFLAQGGSDDYSIMTPLPVTASGGSFSIVINIQDDSDVEGSETIIFDLTAPNGETVLFAPATITIDDDDCKHKKKSTKPN